MKNLKVLIGLLALAASPSLASANETLELADILTPAELAAEMLNDENFDALEAVPTASKPRLFVLVDKSEQRLWVYEDGIQTGSWAVSTGTEQRKCAPSRCYNARTPVGTFTPKRMHFNYTSNLWNARMDRAIFVTGGIALHATYGENISLLGSRASGGCVRQHPDNADRLYRLVKAYGMQGTRVQIRE